jgi:nucleoside-diphosphate-sugar epimerase
LHAKQRLAHEIYHLSAGEASSTAFEIAEAVARQLGRRTPRFLPILDRPFEGALRAAMMFPKKSAMGRHGRRLKVFWPYIAYDTVFDNTRAKQASGLSPVPFPEYCAELYEYGKRVSFRYPYRPFPTRAVVVEAWSSPQALARRLCRVAQHRR